MCLPNCQLLSRNRTYHTGQFFPLLYTTPFSPAKWAKIGPAHTHCRRIGYPKYNYTDFPGTCTRKRLAGSVFISYIYSQSISSAPSLLVFSSAGDSMFSKICFRGRIWSGKSFPIYKKDECNNGHRNNCSFGDNLRFCLPSRAASLCSSSKNVSKRSPKRLAPWST
jgi:hypothetical protein